MGQILQARYLQTGVEEDFTPGVDTAAGVPLEIGGKAAVAQNDIAANKLGSVATSGIFGIVKINSAFSLDDDIWWDSDGNPFNGEAGTGAATNVKADGNFILGNLRLAALDSDETAEVRLNGISQSDAIVDPTDLPEVLTATIAIIDALEEFGLIVKT